MNYREILVSELIESYAPIYPEKHDWEETVRYLYETEPEHMELLSESARRKGVREPVVLEEPDEDYEEGEPLFVLDGTHRVALALREGLFSLPYTTRAEQRLLHPEDERLLVSDFTPKDGEFTDEECDLLFDTLRSWPLDEDRWITSSGGGGSIGGWSLWWDETDESLIPLMKKRLRQLLKKHFPGRKIDFTVYVEEPEED